VSLPSLGELHTAVASGDADIVRDMITNGADVDQRDEFGSTPLHRASWQGDMLLLKTLLSEGADLHARRTDGRTPLEVVELRMRTSGLNPPKGLSFEEGGGDLEGVRQLLREKTSKNSTRTTWMSTIVSLFVHKATDLLCKLIPTTPQGHLDDLPTSDLSWSETERNLSHSFSQCSVSTCASESELKCQPRMPLANLASTGCGYFPDDMVVDFSQCPRP